MYYTGIDWDDKGYVIRILNDGGEDEIKSMYIEKSQDDFITFSEILNSLAKDKSNLCIGIETKHNPIVNYLLKEGFNTYVINPNMMESLRMRHSQSKKKSDDFDAFVIADSLRTDLKNHELVKEQDSVLKQLDLIFRQYSSVTREMNRNTEQLTSLLKDYYPGFLELFSDSFCVTALDFLIEYSDHKSLSTLSKPQIKKFLWNRRCYKHDKINKIYAIAHSSKNIDSDKDILETRKSIAVNLAKKIKSIKQELEEYERMLEKLSDKDEDVQIFRSLPGAGTLISVGLFLIFGRDREQYQSAQSASAISGVVPVTIQSGSYKYDKFRSACNKMYRNTMRQFAFTSLSQSKWALTYYRRKRDERKKNEHALRCLARLWMKVCFAMWKNRTFYDENKHLADIAKHSFNNELSEIHAKSKK